MRISDWSSDVCSSDLASRHVVQRERVAGLPRDVVVGARGIAADAERAHPRSLRVVQRKAAAEHVHATDPRAHQRILRRAEVRGSAGVGRSEEHTSELQSLMRISYAVFCLKKKTSPR